MVSRVIKAMGGLGRVALVIAILAIGFGAMAALSSLKAPPEQTGVAERVLRVEVMEARRSNVPVTIRGLGQARSLNSVAISPEVSGNVVEVHPRLERGEIIPAGELLFRIDQRDYNSALKQAEAQEKQLRSSLERLRKQYAVDRERLATLTRTRDLARQEFERNRQLFEQDEVGTQSGVDATEMAYNQARDAFDQLNQQVSLYPARIEEAQSGIAAAEAQRELALANLERTEVRAPFEARIKEVRLERGQFVRSGTSVLTLSDDSVLEIEVPVDSRDARRWLRFDESGAEGLAWFGSVKPVTCNVKWVEDPDGKGWQGVLHRVADYNTQNRTVTLVVRVVGEAATVGEGALPLVPGMFCSVEIPGREMRDVFALPRWAVSFRDEVYLARDDRLAIEPVEVVRNEEDYTYVAGGIEEGDSVIVTRLADPVPGTKLEIISSEAGGGA